MNKFNTKAIVLKANIYRDADKIYTLLSCDHGRFSSIARGVRKISSRRGGNLDSLNCVNIKVTENNNFSSIDEVSTVSSYKNIKNDLSKSMKAFYMIDLVYKNTEDDSKLDKVFYLLSDSLELLDKSKHMNKDLCIVSFFELNLLKYLGYELNLSNCVSCKRDLNDSWESYFFDLEMGGFYCEKCKSFGSKVDFSSILYLMDTFHKTFNYKEGKFNKKSYSISDSLLKSYLRSHLLYGKKILDLCDI